MKLNVNLRILNSVLIFLIITASSCSKSEEETTTPTYVGTWERSWLDKELNMTLKQTLILNESDFSSEIAILSGDNNILYKEFRGTQSIVDNTLVAQIQSLRMIEDGSETINTNPDDSSFDALIFESLNIHPSFVGTWFFEPGELTLRLDLDGDGSVTGDEGLFVFEKI